MPQNQRMWRDADIHVLKGVAISTAQYHKTQSVIVSTQSFAMDANIFHYVVIELICIHGGKYKMISLISVPLKLLDIFVIVTATCGRIGYVGCFHEG